MLDMVIVGGGYVGLSVAVATKQAAPHLAIEVIEAAPEHVWERDERASAIIAAASRMLEVMGLWDQILEDSQPINRMIVTDSRTSDPVRPVFLTFDGEVEEGRPFAHMVPNVSMVRALRGACEHLGIRIRHGVSATGFTAGSTGATLTLSSGEALRIGRFELARYAAHALMMPYGAFFAAAQRARFDVDLLASRFDVSFEQAGHRLISLGRSGAAAPPFFLMEADHAGNVIRRAGAQGYPQARFGGLCPKLGIHAAFAQPGQLLAERVEMPDGASFLTLSRTLEGPKPGFGERIRRTAILLGCDWEAGSETVYAAAAELPAARVLAGTACRLCERQGCLSRAQPPLTRPLGLDEMVTGLSAFDFQ